MKPNKEQQVELQILYQLDSLESNQQVIENAIREIIERFNRGEIRVVDLSDIDPRQRYVSIRAR